MKARFKGDPNDNWSGPAVLPTYGVDFIKGEWMPVSDEVAVKLAGHSHFDVEGAADPFDHDGDGKPGGSMPGDEGYLYSLKVAELKALAEDRGVDLGDATKKADIIAALELAAEAEGVGA